MNCFAGQKMFCQCSSCVLALKCLNFEAILLLPLLVSLNVRLCNKTASAAVDIASA